MIDSARHVCDYTNTDRHKLSIRRPYLVGVHGSAGREGRLEGAAIDWAVGGDALSIVQSGHSRHPRRSKGHQVGLCAGQGSLEGG